ncbi:MULTISPECIES: hypothetical protein [Streptomyces]|uniref:Uncharacterized protein n=2 Tax=Streptomyces TaxID=1883 RepID=A0A100Y803_9ACTN|nr:MULTISPECIES: hypothetical protein [Streptomyces]KUH39369.1 hypothetical protein ATE80_07255 [Streptomyces kanasensis]UUS30692.1 hypothetical protein NRO40_07500 [Streptomyces changanensis]
MSGSLWLTPPGAAGPGAPVDTLPRIPRAPRQRPAWAAADPLDELTTRLEDLIARAVHPDEIAAILESDGMTDDHIRLTYGREDSFALAEELYARVERRHPEPAGTPTTPGSAGGTPGHLLRDCVLRGLVFALPGLAYVLGAPLLAGPPGALGLPAGTVPLLAGAVTGWVWNQALSHRAYAWLGLGDRPAAARTLLVGAPLGGLLGALVAVAAARPGEWGAVVFAAGQALYLAAATVLLVLGRERSLFGALLPLAGGALAVPVTALPAAARTALILASLLAAVALAARALAVETAPGAPEGRTGRSGGRGRTGAGAGGPAGRTGANVGSRAAPRFAASLPYGLFGLGTGLLVLYTAIGDVLAYGPSAAVAAPSAVALTLSMGPAEWLLHRFRGESLAGLRASTSPAAFRRAAGGVLALCLAAYLTVLLVLAAAGTALVPGAPELGGVRLVTLLLIGAVLWTALLLQSFGSVLSAAVVCAAAAGVQTAALVTGAGEPRAVGAAVAGAAALVLAALCGILLGRATAHRH